MRRGDILNQLELGQEQGKEFIKWWRKEDDFVDFELIEQFVNTEDTFDFENYELLDKSDMLNELKRWQPDELELVVSDDGEVIKWKHKSKDGQWKSFTCPFDAASVMSIFDTVTRGDTVE